MGAQGPELRGLSEVLEYSLGQEVKEEVWDSKAGSLGQPPTFWGFICKTIVSAPWALKCTQPSDLATPPILPPDEI